MPGARGEAVIQISDQREVHVLFTNRALANAEKMLHRGILAIAQGFMDGESGVSDIATLLLAGMQAARQEAHTGGRQMTLNDAFEILDEVGFAAVAGPVMEAISSVLSYGSSNGGDPNG